MRVKNDLVGDMVLSHTKGSNSSLARGKWGLSNKRLGRKMGIFLTQKVMRSSITKL